MRMVKRGQIDLLSIIIGIMLIVGGLLYVINLGSWGLIVASIGLLMEAVKQVVK